MLRITCSGIRRIHNNQLLNVSHAAYNFSFAYKNDSLGFTTSVSLGRRHVHTYQTRSVRKLTGAMERLEDLPSVTRLSEHVVRVLGQNPGKFTLQGTNTYIVGSQNPYTLIDTAEGRDEYIPILESALRSTARSSNPSEPDISDIILSHWHHDHIGGILPVLALLRRLWVERNNGLPYKPPRLHKYPLPVALSPEQANNSPLPSIIKSLTPDLYTPAPNGAAFHDLHDLQTLNTSVDLKVLYTPGHTLDSICLYIPQDKALYTADTVLGQGTAVFEDLSLYLSSLNRMLEFGNTDEYTSLYPAHGPVVASGKEIISMYIKHRLERENQILQVLKTPHPTADGSLFWSTWTVVKTLYASYPESLWLPAARGVDLHLKKLEGEGRVKRMGGEGKDTIWQVIQSPTTPSL